MALFLRKKFEKKINFHGIEFFKSHKCDNIQIFCEKSFGMLKKYEEKCVWYAYYCRYVKKLCIIMYVEIFIRVYI